MTYVIVEKDWVYDYTSVVCSFGHRENLDDLLVGFFLPNGSFYVELDFIESDDCWKYVSYLNGGSKP